MKLRHLLVFILAPLLIPACSNGDDTTTAGRATTSSLVAGQAKVTLITAGQAPRSELRIRPAAGTEQRVTLRQQLSQRVGGSGDAQSLETPGTEFDVLYRVLSTDAERIVTQVTYEASRVVAAPGAAPEVVAQLEPMVKAFVGKQANATFDNRGALVAFEAPDVDLEGSAAAAAEQLLSGVNEQAAALALPFPAEAVGVGAKWRVTSSPRLGGIPMKVVTELTLTQLTGALAVADVEQTLTLVPGPVEVAGAELTVESGRLKGKGVVRWDFAKVVPLTDQTTEGSSVIEAGGQKVELFQRQTVALVAR